MVVWRLGYRFCMLGIVDSKKYKRVSKWILGKSQKYKSPNSKTLAKDSGIWACMLFCCCLWIATPISSARNDKSNTEKLTGDKILKNGF